MCTVGQVLARIRRSDDGTRYGPSGPAPAGGFDGGGGGFAAGALATRFEQVGIRGHIVAACSHPSVRTYVPTVCSHRLFAPSVHTVCSQFFDESEVIVPGVAAALERGDLDEV